MSPWLSETVSCNKEVVIVKINDGTTLGVSSTGNACRRRRTQIEWRELVEQWTKSGEPVKSFCERRRVNVCQFYAWRRRLGSVVVRGRSDSAVRPKVLNGFVEAIVVSEAPRPTIARSAPQGEGRADGFVEVVLTHPRRIRVGGDFDVELLHKLVGLLEEA